MPDGNHMIREIKEDIASSLLDTLPQFTKISRLGARAPQHKRYAHLFLDHPDFPPAFIVSSPSIAPSSPFTINGKMSFPLSYVRSRRLFPFASLPATVRAFYAVNMAHANALLSAHFPSTGPG